MPALTTANIVALVAGSSVLAAIIGQALAELRERWKTKRDAAFAALYVAIALEDYASRCSSVVSDSENHDASNGAAGSAQGNIAELPDYPASVEWKPFGISATTKALSFRVEIDNTRAMISGLWEFDDEDAIVPLVREESARLGLKALTLAIELRRTWKLTPVDYDDDWNVKTHLEERFTHYVEQRKLREERNRKFNEELFGAVQPPAFDTPTQEGA